MAKPAGMVKADGCRRLLLLGSLAVFLTICGCPGRLPPSRICASLPTGRFTPFPAGWVSPDGREREPAVDYAGIALAAKLSQLAYQPDERIRALGEVSIEEVGVDPNGDFPRLFGTKYFLWHDTAAAGGSRHYLVIRGTANFENIFEDVDYPKILDPDLGIWVHRGYYSIAREILQRLHERPLSPDEPIWVTGHSLGGGVALLVYLHLHHEGATLGPLYTFGQPKTLAADAWERFRCLPIVRVVNRGDFVPLVPPAKKDEGCDNPLDAGCHGSYIQLGDEMMLAGDAGCEYRTYHDPNAIGNDVVRAMLEDARHKELKKYLQVHLQDRYYENTRPLADDPGFACVFKPRR